jgi:hypothetical protein
MRSTSDFAAAYASARKNVVKEWRYIADRSAALLMRERLFLTAF